MRLSEERVSEWFSLVVEGAGRGGAGSPSRALRLPHANLIRIAGLVFISAVSNKEEIQPINSQPSGDFSYRPCLALPTPLPSQPANQPAQ
jgi:hypothetical protein